MLTRQRASVICVHNKKLLLVQLVDDINEYKGWFPPGGAIEEGESPGEAAKRECIEETGVAVEIDSQSSKTYSIVFNWRGRDYKSTTTYFKARFISEGSPNFSEKYLLGSHWVPICEWKQYVNTHVGISEQVRECLKEFYDFE